MANDEVDLTDRSTYRFWVRERVRFSDTDLVGHVNNVAVAAYVESGRVDYGHELARRTDSGMRPMVLGHLAIHYRAELHYPAELEVGAALLAIGTSSITIGNGVFDGDRCVATAESVLVLVGENGSAPIDEHFRTLLEAELAGSSADG
ncbi:MAG: hotdog domain-containing protein [Nitriliruptorales bacterium]|nr:hotdog domain-containing protein [Nitriliruptorales bacterium]